MPKKKETLKKSVPAWSEWLDGKYRLLHFRKVVDNKEQFAKLCGVSPQVMGQWMDGRQRPRQEPAEKVAAALEDYEFLVMLGYPVPDEDIQRTQLLAVRMSSDQRKRLRKFAEQLGGENANRPGVAEST